MNTPTPEELIQHFSPKNLAERVIQLEVAFQKLMGMPCNPEQEQAIRDAFPKEPECFTVRTWPPRVGDCPTIPEVNAVILALNDEAFQGELEHHGSATTRFELRSNGDEMCVWFMGHPLWSSSEDERDEIGDGGREHIEAYLRRESEEFMTRILAKPTPE